MSRRKPTPETPAPPPRWATQRETADYGGFSLRTVSSLIDMGMLPAYRLGPKMIRIDLNDVDALMVPINSTATGK